MIKLHTGPMFSGKTYKLLKELRELEEEGNSIVLLKPSIDTRGKREVVKSRVGLERPCWIINESEIDVDILINKCNKYDVIGIDEVQFFSLDFIKVLTSVLNRKDKKIIISGLDMDRFAEPFGETIPYIISVAEEVIKYRAICNDCGKDKVATTEYMDTITNELICIGDTEYIALCNDCREKRIKKTIAENSLYSLYESGYLKYVLYDNKLCEITLLGDSNVICSYGPRLKGSIPFDKVIFYKEGLLFKKDKKFI